MFTKNKFSVTMAADFGTGKTLVVLAIVLGCFAILWPKIFYPMMQTAFAMTSPNIDADGRLRSDTDRPPHLHPAGAMPRGRAGTPADDITDKFMMREGRPFPHPQSRQPAKPQPKTGGAMSIIMPIYTVGIVVFFLYTVLKLVFKKPNEEDNKKPLIKDFHMDPEYRKFVCQQPTNEKTKPILNEKSKKRQAKLCEKNAPEDEPVKMDSKDYEIYKLKKKLEETETAMERIIKHMGVVSESITEKVHSENKVASTRGSDVRQRHKGKKRQQNSHIEEVPDDSTENMATLEEDLSELISLCKQTDAAIKDKGESSEELSEPEEDSTSEDENLASSEEPRKGCSKSVKVA